MRRFWRHLRRGHYRLDRLSLAFALTVMILSLPWLIVIHPVLPGEILGLDGGYFAALFVIPALIGLIMLWAAKSADASERHMRKYENE